MTWAGSEAVRRALPTACPEPDLRQAFLVPDLAPVLVSENLAVWSAGLACELLVSVENGVAVRGSSGIRRHVQPSGAGGSACPSSCYRSDQLACRRSSATHRCHSLRLTPLGCTPADLSSRRPPVDSESIQSVLIGRIQLTERQSWTPCSLFQCGTKCPRCLAHDVPARSRTRRQGEQRQC